MTGPVEGKRSRKAEAAQDRRLAILGAAEALFAERGYAGVSVRDIAGAAKVPLALVGYHFGRKEDLFSAVFAHRSGYVTERIDRIAAVDISGVNPHAVEDLVRAWAEPVIRLRGAGADAFSLLVARTAWDPGPEASAIIERVYDRLAHSLIDAMMQALPGRSRETMVWGYEYALGALLMHVADRRVERLSEGRAQSGDPSMCAFFVHMIAALFRALPTASDETVLRGGAVPPGLRA